MNAETERQKLLKQLEAHVDPEYQAGMASAVPTGLRIYGVRVPQLREMARDWQQAHKKVAREDLMVLVEALWAGDSREERMLAVHLLLRYKRWIKTLSWDHFDRWRRQVDNWEVCDGLSQWVMGAWILDDPQSRLDRLRELIADEDLWSRRMALVATAWLNRGYEGFSCPVLTLELVDRTRAERDPMITKAVSWALRGLIKLHPERVEAYLETHRDELAGHVTREVENKLRTGLKSGRSS